MGSTAACRLAPASRDRVHGGISEPIADRAHRSNGPFPSRAGEKLAADEENRRVREAHQVGALASVPGIAPSLAARGEQSDGTLTSSTTV